MSTQQGKPKRRQRVESGIYVRPDGKYEIGWRDANGRQRWRKVEGGITAARKALRAELSRRDRGEKTAADPRLKFSVAAARWQETHVVRLRPNTQAIYKVALGHLGKEFDGRRMVDISSTDVARFIAAQEKTLKAWTIRGQLVVLRQVFDFAIRHLGMPGSDPVDLLTRGERPKSDEREKRTLNPEELRRLIAAVPTRHRALFMLAAETGARLGETLGLIWSEVDFGAQTITFTHQLDRQGQRVALKTKRSRRTVEITAALVVRLREHKMASAFKRDDQLVFCTARGTGHDHRNIAGRILARAVKSAGLGSPAPTFHSLRHSHASALIAEGWDVAQVSTRLGHASPAITAAIYTHDFDSANRSDARRESLAALYGEAGSVR